MGFKHIVFANGTLDDNVHEMIDSSLILAFSKAYPSVDVHFLKKRSIIIKQLLDEFGCIRNISYYKHWNFKKNSFYKDIWGAFLDAYVLLFKGGKDTLFFL